MRCFNSQHEPGRRVKRDSLAFAVGHALVFLSAGSAQAADPNALPSGGRVVGGSATIQQSALNRLDINQQTQRAAIDWTAFNIGSAAHVNFAQPSSSAVALNRVLGSDASQIYGKLTANGQVFLVNPRGVLFGRGAQVEVGSLVATALDISPADFMSGRATFKNTGTTGSIINQGTINAASGGYVALLAPEVRNEGIITARLGTVAAAAGDQVTLDFRGDRLINFTVDRGALNAKIDNRHLIQADGGMVIMSARAAGDLASAVVNNDGIIQARTLDDSSGVIKLLGDMQHGTVRAAGTLDASAPNGGDGGFIETSAACVKLDPVLAVTTAAPAGKTGNWLIDPNDYTIAASGGDTTGAQLGAQLANNNITILSSSGATAGNGDIFVNDPVSWSANTTLTLSAFRNIEVNANITATGNSAGLVLTPSTFDGGSFNPNSGYYYLKNGAQITLSGTNPSLNIRGFNYTVINDINGLQAISASPSSSAFYALGIDIDAAATASWNNGAGFSPIGGFYSILDGLGHTISNLNIYRPSTTDPVGLFGALNIGTIKNIGLENVSIVGGGLTGGLVGLNFSGTVSDVFVTGAVTGKTTGGVIGQNSGTLRNAYAAGSITASGAVGGVVGINYMGITENAHYNVDQMTINGGPMLTVGGLYGAQYQDWLNRGRKLNIADYSTTLPFDAATGAYVISNVHGLKDMLGFADGTGYKFRLTANIDLAGNPGFHIPYFTGSFDGGGHVISNLLLNSPEQWNQGLFGLLQNGASVTNIGATDVLISGGTNVGGLVGWNFGGTVRNSYATGSVTSENIAGGLVGENQFLGTVSNSYAAVDVEGWIAGGLVGRSTLGIVRDAYATGKVHGFTVGGLIGSNEQGVVINTYATGPVTSYPSFVIPYPGYPIGQPLPPNWPVHVQNPQIGGLIGSNNNSGVITNSFYDSTTTGVSAGIGFGTAGGATGLTTADMQIAANFTSATATNGNVNPNWDFASTWGIPGGSGAYPVLVPNQSSGGSGGAPALPPNTLGAMGYGPYWLAAQSYLSSYAANTGSAAASSGTTATAGPSIVGNQISNTALAAGFGPSSRVELGSGSSVEIRGPGVRLPSGVSEN